PPSGSRSGARVIKMRGMWLRSDATNGSARQGRGLPSSQDGLLLTCALGYQSDRTRRRSRGSQIARSWEREQSPIRPVPSRVGRSSSPPAFSRGQLPCPVIPAGEVRERGAFAEARGVDLAEEDGVVAAVVGGLDAADEGGQAVVQERNAEGADRVGQVRDP